MSPPFIVAPRTSIVDETPPSTKKFKIWNLKFFSFRELKSATKSKQNGLMKRNRSKSPENRSKSIVNETPSSSGIKSTENRSKSIVNETPSSSGNIKTLNPKVFTYAEMKSAEENFRSSSSGNIKTLNLKVFTYAELKSATENFNPDSLIGEGGYGQVFKGWVHEKTYQPSKVDVRMAVAIKKSQLESFQGLREWQTEIEFMGNLSHPNIIKLVGYCSKEDKEYLLVYKYAQKGSLENHLFKNSAEPLPWSIRLKIAIGAARGLAFLHTSEKPVIHRDFKSANILLDRDYNAKLADFGLAKYAPSKGDAQVTTQIKGTLGPTNDDMQVTMQISWPNGDTQVTTQVRGTLSSTNNDTQLTMQISRSNCETHVTTQLRSMLGSTNSDMHVTTQIRGMSNLANDDRHVTTHIRTNPANSNTHVTTQIRGASHQADGNSHVTTRVMGTSGYAAPEYVATGHLYVKSDVYSFGVVFLEILTGFRAIDTNRAEEIQNLVEWAKPFLSNNRNLKEIMDKRLGDQYPPEGANQAAQLALKCVNHDPNERPSMIEVLENIEQIYAIQ